MFMNTANLQRHCGLHVAPCSTKARVGRTIQASSNGNGSSGWNVTDVYGTTAVLGPTMNADGAYSMPEKKPEPPSPEVQAILEEQGLDLEISGLKYLNNEGRVCCL